MTRAVPTISLLRLLGACFALSLAGCSGAPIVGTDSGIDGGLDATPTCTAGMVVCGSVCADTQTDPAHCGACAHACGSSMVCVAGACQLTCPGGASPCSGVCFNLNSDNANCGACGNACPAGEVCSASACGVTCAMGYATCGGAGDAGAGDGGAAAYCADLATDANNCGACGAACPAGNVCVNHACQVTCPTGESLCASTCVNFTADNANCGSCGNACPAGNVCSAGACVVSCASGQVACASGCANLQTDNANCGACGTSCPAGRVCSAGACATTCAAPLVTCTGASGSACANTLTDPANCGMCGNVCALPGAATNGCTAGACSVVVCSAGEGDCDGMAADGCETDLTTSSANCGACGHACVLPNATSSCAASTCAVGTCATGFSNCDGMAANGCEVNTQTDNANCGGCGTTCPVGQVCSGGHCGTTCAAPLVTCVGAAGSSCVSTSSDPANCGSCGAACSLAHVAVNTCAMGACAVAGCVAGYADCDRLASNGCEVSLTGDSANCGACGRACALANASATCASGACGIGACTAGYADCNHVAADGCETSLATDNANCGGCGTACAAGQVCSHGACSATCASPLATCGTGAAQYCANTSVDPANCGACGAGCALANTASNGCASGTCTVLRCNASFGDCDGVAVNGCETNLTTSAASCGACGHVCNLPNATPACAGGSCTIVACLSNYADCDHNPANGCEVSTASDSANCGACGTVCGAGQVCSHGACSATCASPLSTCGTAPSQYCSNTAADPANCGSCGTVCALANVATQGCSAGACIVVACATGRGDCDHAASNGCEATLATDNANCGACGHACTGGQSCAAGACVCPSGQTLCGGACTNTQTDVTNCGACGLGCSLSGATASCVSGACAIAACGTGLADCDHAPADGCEVNTQTDASNCGACGHVCAAGTLCSRGTCTTTCAPPLTTCGTSPSQYCANTAIDPSNCGSCAHACALTNVATDTCTAGGCTVGACTTGFGDCNGTASDGCETNLNTTLANCGACGRACSLANAASACTAGACTIASCSAGYADCDHVASDGCEASLLSDNANCGGCGTTCPAGQVCAGGHCGTTCASPLTACGTGSTAYCANTANDPANCGACGFSCGLAHTATDGCASGSCSILRCTTGFGDCNATASDGCETNLTTSAANCGACGAACALPNASSTCTSSACAISACTAGYADCDHTASNGCEINTQTNNANCGSCGVGCAAGQVCSSGACVATCGATEVVCSGACVNETNDPTHCGGCSTVCPSVSNAAAVCAASSCAFVCSAGYADCNRVSSDGCEANLNASTTNCGLCGNVCPARANAGTVCTSGTCSFTCSSGYADCNHTASDGCEVNTQTDASNCGACGVTCGGAACVGGACASVNKIVFVSSVMYTGNLGGLAGADADCQGLARAAGLSGTYLAWLSTDTVSAASRMTHSTGPYVLVNGTTVASNWTGLTSGTLLNPITLTERGGAVPIGTTSCAGGGYPTVWTDTTNMGTEAFSGGDNCSNWTSTTPSAIWGLASSTGSWSDWCSGGICSWVSPIYCVEQ